MLFLQSRRKNKWKKGVFVLGWIESGLVGGFGLAEILHFTLWICPISGIVLGTYGFYLTTKWKPEDIDKEEWENQIEEIGKN
jgi:hypothetical protein